MILARLERDALRLQHRRHVRVASNGLRLVVVIGEHRIHIQGLCELRDRVARRVVNHMQRAAQCLKRCTKFRDAFPDEFNAAIQLVL